MNKVVTSKTLAGSLPREVRGDIDPGHRVEVTVRDIERPPETAAPARPLAELIGAGRGVYGSTDEIRELMRELREDRDA